MELYRFFCPSACGTGEDATKGGERDGDGLGEEMFPCVEADSWGSSDGLVFTEEQAASHTIQILKNKVRGDFFIEQENIIKIVEAKIAVSFGFLQARLLWT